MPEVSVIARPGKVQTDDVVVTMHAVKQENHELRNTVTDHPVEEGYNISDHSRPEPETVSMECTISNTPVSSKQQTQAVRSGEYTFNTTSEEAGAIGDTKGFAFGEWDKLKKLRDKGTLVTIVTTLGDYKSMAITSITAPRTSKNYDAVQFTIAFKKVRVVKNKLTKGVKSSDPRAQPKKSTGAQTKKGGEDSELPSSAAATGADSMSQSKNASIKGVGDLLSSGAPGT